MEKPTIDTIVDKVVDKLSLPKRIKKPRKPRTKKPPTEKVMEKEMSKVEEVANNNEKDYSLEEIVKISKKPKKEKVASDKRKGQPEILKKIQIEAKKYRLANPKAKWTICIKEGSKVFKSMKK